MTRRFELTIMSKRHPSQHTKDLSCHNAVRSGRCAQFQHVADRLFSKSQVTKTSSKAIQIARPSKKGQRLDRYFQRLCHLLRQLSPERRRSILAEKFTQLERLLLERWMLARKAYDGAGSSESDPQFAAAPDLRDTAAAVVVTTKRATSGTGCLRRNRNASSSEKTGGKVNQMTRNSAPRREKRAGSSQGDTGDDCTRCRGIQSCSEPGGQVSYFIKLMVADNLLIRTNIVRDFGLMRSALDALLAVRAAVAGVGAVELEERLRGALHHSFWDAPWNPGHLLRLRFCVIVAARCWIGQQLVTPYFSDLSAALAARCRLIWARGATSQGNRSDLLKDIEAEATWENVIATYAAVCAEAGRSHSAAWSRLSSLRRRECVRRCQAKQTKGVAVLSQRECRALRIEQRRRAREVRKRSQVQRQMELAARHERRTANRTARATQLIERRILKLLASFRRYLAKLTR